jgi:hypothetical protein
MTANDFRRIALSLPEATENAHVGHPDFRVSGKIFATLGWPDDDWGMVKPSAKEQMKFFGHESAAFAPVKGAWGRNGSTQVRLGKIDRTTLRKAIVAAWRRAATQPKTKTKSRPKILK